MTNNQSTNTNPTNGATATTVPAYPYHYFVSFAHATRGGSGFANTEVELSVPITSIEQVRDLETYFAEQGYHEARVMGFTLLRNDLATASPTTGRPGGDR
ncbi:hypothetical protein [Actinoplanes aureus]|uniref:Uncharacterized protein n=1 Tax=Actinoplanes aureus TaxID=2792083 RepID=A0A931CFY4_9ACTN|nr:hypothetical protein [Actinoplanes aureus]MBG0567919.1 hypothetical protein [Actinoplanes aureus]